MQIKVYKIRDKKTGLFSTGGQDPDWTTKGKTWTAKNHVNAHLNQFVPDKYSTYRKGIPDTWEVLEFVLIPATLTDEMAHKAVDFYYTGKKKK